LGGRKARGGGVLGTLDFAPRQGHTSILDRGKELGQSIKQRKTDASTLQSSERKHETNS